MLVTDVGLEKGQFVGCWWLIWSFFSRKYSSQQHYCRPPWFLVISHNLCASEWFEGFNNYHLGSVTCFQNEGIVIPGFLQGVIIRKFPSKNGYIDVDDECWRRLLLVTYFSNITNIQKPFFVNEKIFIWIAFYC